MSHVTRRGPVKPSLNITPLIDVVFLLIVFFMIVNNIVTDEVPELQLPDLDKPEVYETEGDSRVIVNIVPVQAFEPANDARPGPGHPVGQVLARPGDAEFVTVGKNKWRIEEEGAMAAFQEFVIKSIKARMDGQQSPDILLRVDAAIYYAQVLPIMFGLQDAMAKALGPEIAAATPIQLVAYMPDND